MHYLRIALLMLLMSSGLFAQQQLTHISRYKESSIPDQFFKYGDKTLFTAYTAQTGRELWITDGTENGTFMLKDITEGVLSSKFKNFVIFRNEVYFIADGLLNQQLWKTNATSSGTVRVSDNIFSGVYDNMTATDKFIFFLRGTQAGIQLWRSDGTASGTVIVNPNLQLYESPINMTPIGDALFFTARSSTESSATSSRIWTSDGTMEGTKSIGPPIASGEAHFYDALANHPRSLLFYKGAFYFIGLGNFGGVTEMGLMKSELTGGDPVNIKGIIKENIDYNEYVDFVQGTIANNKLYVQLFQSYPNRLTIVESDGTAAGTNVIFQKSFTKYFGLSELLVDQSSLYFTAGNDQGGISFVKIDLNSKVASEVKQLAQGASSPIVDIQDRQITGFIRKNAAGKIIIYSWENDRRSSLWSSDGTSSNTIKMSTPIIYPSLTTETTFSGYSNNEYELWTYDGMSEHAKFLKDIEPGLVPLRGGPILSVNHAALTILNEGTTGTRALTPWLTDGSGSGTHAMAGSITGNIKYAYGLQNWGDRAAFLGLSDNIYHAYAGDPNTLDDLYQFKNISGSESPLAVSTNDQTLFFADQIERTVNLLKVVKGSTTPETVMSFGGSGQPISYISSLTGSEKYVYFFVTTDGASSLWRSDGTTPGTVKLYDSPSNMRLIAPWKDKVFAFSGNVLFVGDPQTKTLVRLTKNGDYSFPILNSTSTSILQPQLDKGLLFLGQSDNEGFEQWTTDGTLSGTKILKDIGVGQLSGGPVGAYIYYKGKMYFSAVDAEHGAELWVTDGTAENTKLLKDIVPGTSSSIPLSFFIHKDKILFTAWTPEYGTELWYTDGTTTGTGIYVDIVPGPVGSLPFMPSSLDDQVIFFANASSEGEQLFSYTPPILATEQPRESLKAYPNPTNGLVHIEASDTGHKSIELITIDGRKILTFEQSEPHFEIDLRQQADGLYFLKIAHEGRIDVVKIMKR